MKKQIGLIVIGLLLFTNGFSQTDNVLYQEIDSIVNSASPEYPFNGQLLRWIEPNGVFKNLNSDSFKKISLELADYATSLASDFKKQ
jgi:hypothetical protein